MASERARLRAARRMYLSRVGAPTASDRWFSLYLIAFVAGWYVLPVAYVIGNSLTPEFANSLTTANATRFFAFGLSLLGLFALLFGRVQGPVFLTPFLAHTMLETDISRRRLLLRPTLTALIAIGTAVGAVSAVGMFAMTQAGVWTWVRFGELVIAAFLGGLHLGLLALWGQRAAGRWLAAFSAAIVLISGLHVVTPDTLRVSPPGWFSLLWYGADRGWTSELWPLLLLAAVAVAGIVALATVPVVLGRLPAKRVLAQSRRLADARLFTATGSINDAVELLRAKPQRRLPGKAVFSAAGIVQELFSGLRQDFVTAMRAPVSVLGAIILVPAGFVLLTIAVDAVGEDFAESRLILTVPAGLAGAVLTFMGTGSLTEGWRHLKCEFDAAALYGWSSRAALRRRLLWPVMTMIVLIFLGIAVAALLDHLSFSGAVWATGLAVVTLSARFFQSMRPRDIPVEFLAPTVIPGGLDLSAVKTLLWLGDGLIVTTTAVLAVIVLPWQPVSLALVLGALLLTATLWGWARTGHRFLVGAPKGVVQQRRQLGSGRVVVDG